MSEKKLRELKSHFGSRDITEGQRETIQRYDKHKVAMRHWKSVNTRVNNAKVLKHLGAHNHKPYEDMTEDDIIDFFDSKNFTESSRNFYIIVFRTFFGWLYGLPEGKGEYPDCIKNFKTPTPKLTITKSMLITDQEKIDMIRCADRNYRDAAIITVLQESMFRPGEFLSMNIGDVEERDYGFSVSCPTSKTFPRSVPLVISARYLADWLNHHPHKDDPDKPLWISLYLSRFETRFKIASLNKLVKTIAKRAGIKKRVWSYLFRHTGITFLAANGTNEALMRLLCGWSKTSTMPTRYTHLAGRDAEDAVLEIHGIRKRKSQPLMTPKYCPRCAEENNPEMTYCGKCATHLDLPLENIADFKKMHNTISEMQNTINAMEAQRMEGSNS